VPTRARADAEGSMSILEHLDELRSRLIQCLLGLVVAVVACWMFSDRLLEVMLRPIREHMFGNGEIVFLHLTEPFMIHMKAAGLAGVFLASPWILYQLWAFIAPGLYRRERRLVVPFLVLGTFFFVAGGVFGYLVATPVAARWLLAMGHEYVANISLRSAFEFESRVVLGMGAVFELPVLVFFLARLGVVTPGFLMRHFRHAVLVIAILAAVVTPTGDMITMTVFGGPMVVLYLLGVAIAWLVGGRPRGERDEEA
jgi:sec-independent protein translocase protein TatC